jgi:hypothetical protein
VFTTQPIHDIAKELDFAGPSSQCPVLALSGHSATAAIAWRCAADRLGQNPSTRGGANLASVRASGSAPAGSATATNASAQSKRIMIAPPN